ncbi:MAG: response regulator transcription factor [Chloroflexi bacterium]|nr:response regulator transcription factor [Chloroflexota bacterium]
MGKIRVLLVDDHIMLREGLKALLNLSDDCQVVAEASDGREAITCVREHSPDVVVMDMAMPGMDGLEATKRIIKERPQTKILVLSQHDNERYVLPILQAGAMGYVLKRSFASELVNAIRAVSRGEVFVPPAITKMLLTNYRQQTEPAPEENDDVLTEREKEVLKLVAEGRSSQDIADLLNLSKKTVMCHRANIMTKLNIHNRANLVKYALGQGLIELDV